MTAGILELKFQITWKKIVVSAYTKWNLMT